MQPPVVRPIPSRLKCIDTHFPVHLSDFYNNKAATSSSAEILAAGQRGRCRTTCTPVPLGGLFFTRSGVCRRLTRAQRCVQNEKKKCRNHDTSIEVHHGTSWSFRASAVYSVRRFLFLPCIYTKTDARVRSALSPLHAPSASSGLDEQRDRRALVQQPELRLGCGACHVAEDPLVLDQDVVHVGHHAPCISQLVPDFFVQAA